jgi:ribonuclease HI
VYKIKDVWRKKQVTSVLFLDIEGAFPNAVNKKLVKNLTKRQVPSLIIQFMINMLIGRMTCLKFDDHKSERININNSIGQGDPLSMVLYQYYNADLLDIPNSASEFAAAYVDDTILVATAKTFEDAHETLSKMMTREGGALQWAREHNLKFEMSKLALMDFTHQSKKVTRPPLLIANTEIEASKSAKYLGVFIDQNLSWKEQEVYATKKGAAWAVQIRRVVRPDWGLTPKFARRMYISVMLLRILYAIDIWAPPTYVKKHKAKPLANKRFTMCLSSIQRAGTLAVVGGLRTSPTDALCAHADILAVQLELDKSCHRAAARMAMLLHTHPITKLYCRSAKHKVKQHKSPLHFLSLAFEAAHNKYKMIVVAGCNPALMGKHPFRTDIQGSKDNSKEVDKQAPEQIKIYSDGSAHDSKVGAAAIMTKNSRTTRAIHYHLGSAEEHMVFEAELVGILMGLYLIETNPKGNASYTIGVDNQAALKALTSKFSKPGQYLAAEALKAAAHLRKTKGKKYALTFRWTPGHSGIPGNKEADIEAKKAAEGVSSDQANLPKTLRRQLKRSKSASIQAENTTRKARWRREWAGSPRYAKFKNIDPSLPSHKFIKLISNPRISRADASKIFQLQSGHIPLNAYLHHFKQKDNTQCPACRAPKETPQHFLLECLAYAYKRWKLRPKKGELEAKFTELLTSEKKIITLAHFVNATGRFSEESNEHPTKETKAKTKEAQAAQA